jgi:hypothetical protein
MRPLVLVAGAGAPPRVAFTDWFARVLVMLFVLLLSWRTPDGPAAGGA